jgi:hypothetical protein
MREGLRHDGLGGQWALSRLGWWPGMTDALVIGLLLSLPAVLFYLMAAVVAGMRPPRRRLRLATTARADRSPSLRPRWRLPRAGSHEAFPSGTRLRELASPCGGQASVDQFRAQTRPSGGRRG